jgi:hypothetical protein
MSRIIWIASYHKQEIKKNLFSAFRIQWLGHFEWFKMAETSNQDFSSISSTAEVPGRDPNEVPGRDPNNKHYLKFCFVCEEEAKPNQVSRITIFWNWIKKLDHFFQL